jgi:hypothetical protein
MKRRGFFRMLGAVAAAPAVAKAAPSAPAFAEADYMFNADEPLPSLEPLAGCSACGKLWDGMTISVNGVCSSCWHVRTIEGTGPVAPACHTGEKWWLA